MKIFAPHELLNRIRELSGVATFLMETDLSATVRCQLLQQLSSHLDRCFATCTDLELRMSALRIAQLRKGVDALSRLSAATVAEAAERIKMDVPLTIEHELSLQSFLRITPDRKEFFDEPRKGWEEVINRFTDSLMDVEEMRKCFALSRYAGCVFHSVQVIEFGLIHIGKWLPNLNDPKAGWPSVTRELERIVDLPYPKRTTFEQTHFVFIEQTNALVKSLKHSWRNKISHASGRLHVLSPDFAAEIAEEIMMATRGFMRKLATDLPV